MKTIIFRVDGNEKIATGHIMRCISYAYYFKRKEFECIFVTANDCMNYIIEAKGFRVISLNTEYNKLDNEIEQFQKIIKEYSPLFVVIDSYFVTENYLKAISKISKTLYIDDLNTFDYPVDAVLNYSIYAKELNYNKSNKKYFLGIDYLALRPEFDNKNIPKKENEIKNIFITTGGSDNKGFTFDFITDEIKKDRNFNYHIIIGKFFSAEDKLKIAQISKENLNVILYENIDNMCEIMQKCDIAISAGGSTLYELLYLNIPTIAIITAENQRLNVETFTKKGLMLYGGDKKSEYLNHIQVYLEAIYNKTLAINSLSLKNPLKDKKSDILDYFSFK